MTDSVTTELPAPTPEIVRSDVTFYSDGAPVRARYWRPADDPRPRVVVHAPGWSGCMKSTLYDGFDRDLVSAGFGVLSFDYRGFGDSVPDPRVRSLTGQIRDIRNAVEFAGTLSPSAERGVGLFSSGATGAGHVFGVAARDRRVRAVVSQFPIARGREWVLKGVGVTAFEQLMLRVAADRRRRVLGAESDMVHRNDIRPRPSDAGKADIVKDLGVDGTYPFTFVEELLEYDATAGAAHTTAPTLIVVVEDDLSTPDVDGHELYEILPGTKKLIVQRHTTHSVSYAQYGAIVMAETASWFDRHLTSPDIVTVES